MSEFKGTKGNFKDGTTGWKAVAYPEGKKVGLANFEIHFSDDGECVAEVVHEEADAKLIAAAFDLLEALIRFDKFADDFAGDDYVSSMRTQAKAAIKKALE
jgi:hypothetical protein